MSKQGGLCHMTQISRERLENLFREVNASWSFEDSALSAHEKDLLFQRLLGDLTDEDYNKAIMEFISSLS